MAAYFPADEVDEVCDRYRAIYADLGPPGSSLLPGAADAFAAVRARAGVTLVVTAKYGPNAAPLPGPRRPRRRPRRGLAPRTPEGRDPARARRRTSTSATRVPDIEAARQAGRPCRGRGSGRSTADELRAAGADVVLDTLAAFPAWLADSCGLTASRPPASAGARSATSAAA